MLRAYMTWEITAICILLSPVVLAAVVLLSPVILAALIYRAARRIRKVS